MSFSLKKVQLTLNVRVEGSLSEGQVEEREGEAKKLERGVVGAYRYEPLILTKI